MTDPPVMDSVKWLYIGDLVTAS